MNCRPNDLAMVVRSTSGLSCLTNVIGSPVRVTSLRTRNAFGYGPAWDYGAPLRCPKCQRRIDFLLDTDLQPLRPPPLKTVADILREEILGIGA